MPLRIVLFTALLPHILADDGFIPVTAYRTDAGACGPPLATPQTLFDGRDTVQDLAGRETFDALDGSVHMTQDTCGKQVLPSRF
jgi:hypothetical protein